MGEAGRNLDRLIEVIAALREHCPWTAALTHESLVEYLIEECYELVDALEQPGAREAASGAVRGELGDILLQVVVHSRLAEERGDFAMADVVDGLSAKMVRRNPHVFHPDGTLRTEFPATVEEIVDTWHSVKRTENPERDSVFAGLPHHLPALSWAAKSISRAAGSAAGSADSPAEGESEALAAQPVEAEQIGDQIFALAEAAVRGGIDPEQALRAAVRRYQGAISGPAVHADGARRHEGALHGTPEPRRVN